MAHPPLTVSHRSEVTEEQIDQLGHMNVRWYAHHAFAATDAFAGRLDIDAPTVRSAYTRHHHEQLLGNRLEVRTGVLADPTGLRLYHELRNSADDDLAATFVHELDHPAIEAPMIELPPHGLPRSIALDTDGPASAPTLDVAIAHGLAIRHPRAIDDEDSTGLAAMPRWNAPSLFWGGDAIDGRNEWIRTGQHGERIASATMESRLWILRLPERGTRIQSFGAPIALAEKISQNVHWSFDLASGELLGVMATVNIVFDLDARRAIPVPDDERADIASRLRPDLAPAPAAGA